MILLYDKTQQFIKYGAGLMGIRHEDERPRDILISVRELVNIHGAQDPHMVGEYIFRNLYPALRSIK